MSAFGILANAAAPMVAKALSNNHPQLPSVGDETEAAYQAASVRMKDPQFWQTPRIDWGLLAAVALAGYVGGLMMFRR